MKVKVLETWAFHGSALFYLLTAIWSVGYFLWDRRFRLVWAQRFLLAGFVLETLALFARGALEGRLPIFSRFEFLVLVAWALVACCLVMSYFYKVRLIIPFAMPVIAILFTVVSVADFSTHGQQENNVSPMDLIERVWLGLHVSALFVSMGCFVLSSGTSLMYLLQERRLKNGRDAVGWASRLPALEKLDRLSFRSIGFGHLLLTLGLLIPVVMAGGSGMARGPGALVIWGVVVWLVYAVLFVLRLRVLLGRRMIALLTIAGAIVGTLAYPVIRFLFDAAPTLHQTLS